MQEYGHNIICPRTARRRPPRRRPLRAKSRRFETHGRFDLSAIDMKADPCEESIQTDRVILIPGPADEIAVILQIFAKIYN
jgi:hypothetical protein